MPAKLIVDEMSQHVVALDQMSVNKNVCIRNTYDMMPYIYVYITLKIILQYTLSHIITILTM
jgi:hypothetical protein